MERKEIEQLFRDYYHDVYRTAFLYLSNKEDTEDAAMEVFAKLLKKSLTSISNLKPYLLKSAINLAKGTWRKKFRRKEFPSDMESYSLEEAKTTSMDLALIRDMPLKLRSVIILFYFDELTVGEISEVLSISGSNVKVRLFRGREYLKEKLT